MDLCIVGKIRKKSAIVGGSMIPGRNHGQTDFLTVGEGGNFFIIKLHSLELAKNENDSK